MTFVKRRVIALACAGLLSGPAISCGGSSQRPNLISPSNVQAMVVNGGPNGNYANGLFITLTVCAPGGAKCQSVPDVLVDSGSFGLRLLSSALGNVGSALLQQKDGSGNSVYECAQFVTSVVWGPVKSADVRIGSESAGSVPIEVIDSNTIPVPTACKALGPAEETVSALGANGILGVGFFQQDCGSACSISGPSNPGFYYSCAGSSCQVTAESNAQQVQNPVGFFATDNNGVILHLPPATTGAAVTGSLTFGIGTQSNNAIGSAQVFRPDSFGNLKTTFNSQTYAGFIDSGSNGYFFLDSSSTGLTDCPTSQQGFYCPASPATFSATNTSGASSNTVNFTVGNASQLFAANSGFAFSTLGGPDPAMFDWGLPFFFGRNIYVALEGRQTPAGPGPFWAY